MPDASPHCKLLAAELGGVLTERLATRGGVAKASDAPTARAEIKAISRVGTATLYKAPLGALAWRIVHRWKQARAPILNATHKQADQARPNRRRPRLISWSADARDDQVCGMSEDAGGIPEANFLRTAFFTTALRTAFFTTALRTAFFTTALRTAFFTAALRTAFLATTFRTAFFAAPFFAGLFLAADFFAVFLVAAFGM
jgi:hypothetical protein